MVERTYLMLNVRKNGNYVYVSNVVLAITNEFDIKKQGVRYRQTISIMIYFTCTTIFCIFIAMTYIT